MTQQINVFGACTVKVGTGSAGALETLGMNRNQADVVHQPYFINVPGDANGGDEGPPIDVQYLGEIVLVRLELTTWDPLVAEKIRARVRGGTVGSVPTAGLLMIAGGYYTRICLVTPVSVCNFPIAIIRGANEFGVGTRFSTFVTEFEAHADPSTRKLYDSVQV